MFAFLRKIRKSLIDSGSTRKYLLYAIGEILLVMIGILLALRVNNINQDRLNRIEEQELLKLINTEMVDYLWLQERGTERQNRILESVERLLLAMNQPIPKLNKDQIDHDLHIIYTTRWIAGAGTATNVYDILVNGGKFGILSSKELQQRLSWLKENFTYTRVYDQFQAEFIDKSLSPFLNKYIDRLSISGNKQPIDSTLVESKFETSYKELMTSREFSNLLVELIKHTNPIISAYQRVNYQIMKIDSLTLVGNPSLTSINKELD
jgi:hypothetical protein